MLPSKPRNYPLHHDLARQVVGSNTHSSPAKEVKKTCVHNYCIMLRKSAKDILHRSRGRRPGSRERERERGQTNKQQLLARSLTFHKDRHGDTKSSVLIARTNKIITCVCKIIMIILYMAEQDWRCWDQIWKLLFTCMEDSVQYSIDSTEGIQAYVM